MITYDEMAAEADREVKMRYEVYGRSSGGKLTPAQQRRIAVMEKIAEHFRKLAESERLL